MYDPNSYKYSTTEGGIALKKAMELCKGRHNIDEAIDGAVFPNSLDPLDLDTMDSLAEKSIGEIDELDLYVTGLSVALTSVINYCRRKGVKLTLYHYDKISGEYYPQPVE